IVQTRKNPQGASPAGSLVCRRFLVRLSHLSASGSSAGLGRRSPVREGLDSLHGLGGITGHDLVLDLLPVGEVGLLGLVEPNTIRLREVGEREEAQQIVAAEGI